MSHYVSDPPEIKTVTESEPQEASERPLAERPWRGRSSRVGFGTFFVLIGLSLLLFSAQILLGLIQSGSPSSVSQTAQITLTLATTPSASAQGTPLATPTSTAVVPFFAPSNAPMSPLHLAAGHYVLYQDLTHVYLVSTTDNTILSLYTPSYTYSQAVRPLLLPDGRLLYSGDKGIWLTDLFDQQPTQLVEISANEVITSLALSQDGTMIAWTTESSDNAGQISIYAGPLTNPQLVRQQSALDCPCLRIFSFLGGTAAAADHTLLLTDDRGSNSAVQYGLWSLDFSTPQAEPQLIMGENTQQGPLAFIPYSTTLLYAPYEGAVPVPTDNSVPFDVAALSYANSLSMVALDGTPLTLGAEQSVLKDQKNLANSPQAYWLTTPTFSPDGQTLAYVEFSSDPQAPYERHSALYTVQVSGSGAQRQIGRPQLVVFSSTRLLELGPWLNSHIITLYGDSSIYALDIQSDALTTLVAGGGNHYLRILGTVGIGQT